MLSLLPQHLLYEFDLKGLTKGHSRQTLSNLELKPDLP